MKLAGGRPRHHANKGSRGRLPHVSSGQVRSPIRTYPIALGHPSG